MNKVLTIALFGAVAGNAWAGTETGSISPYVATRAGLGLLSSSGVDTLTGPSLGAAAGAKFALENNMAVRVEGEFGYNSFSEKDSIDMYGTTVSIDSTYSPMTFMANAYFDFMTDYKLKPYVGAGAGIANFDIKVKTSVMGMSGTASGSQSGFTYGLYGGVGFNIVEDGSVAGDVGVRYVSMSIESETFNVLSFNAGVKYMF